MEKFEKNLKQKDNIDEIEVLRVPDIQNEEFQNLKKQEGINYLHALKDKSGEEKKEYIQKEKEILSEQIRDMNKNGYTEEHPKIIRNKARLRALYELEN